MRQGQEEIRRWAVPLAILIVTAIAFWAVPYAWRDRPVEVTFEGDPR
ncbi:MAG: hypothetical protein KIT11_04495 [Fimbriimonadaceae bacterium]|nr:hypothetical protein [Fimbriimonadaceae bacterium]QYK56847.1 MAG: hypothetical protein KF733_05030 [Fimbriimonadaceae bacterium]